MSIVVFTTILTLSALYAPQPLLPAIVGEFGVAPETAALLTTISFVPLSIAPLIYGYLLETIPPRGVLRIAVLLLAISEVFFFLAPTFSFLMILRLFQGLLIPALLTALMTQVSQAGRGSGIQRGMAVYIASTILGGFLGRACSGLVASWLGWRASFLVLAASLGVCFLLLGRLRQQVPMRLIKPSPRIVLEVLRSPVCRNLYLTVFCLFLVFSAIMNFLPFRLTEISSRATELRIGMMYAGYLMGIVTSLNAVRISRRVGGEKRAILLGLGFFAATLLALGFSKAEILFPILFLFCGAMFLVHATASGYLNRFAGENKGIVNGLYVAFYYSGGVTGSWLPGLLYRNYGWGSFLLLLFIAVLGGLAAAARIGKEPFGENRHESPNG